MNVNAERLRCSLQRLVAPEEFEQFSVRDRPVVLERQRCEQRPLLRSTEIQELTTAANLERSENRHMETGWVECAMAPINSPSMRVVVIRFSLGCKPVQAPFAQCIRVWPFRKRCPQLPATLAVIASPGWPWPAGRARSDGRYETDEIESRGARRTDRLTKSTTRIGGSMRHNNAIKVALTVGALLASMSAVPAAAAARPLSDQIVSTLTVTGQSEVQNADGSVTDKWTVDGSPISVSGPAHMEVTAELTTVNGQHRLLLGATPPPATKASIHLAAASYPQPYKSWCLTYHPNNDGEIYACDYQQLLYQSGSNWYLSDHLTESGHYGNGIFDRKSSFGDRLRHMDCQQQHRGVESDQCRHRRRELLNRPGRCRLLRNSQLLVASLPNDLGTHRTQ